jgi:hypothetical protein
MPTDWDRWERIKHNLGIANDSRDEDAFVNIYQQLNLPSASLGQQIPFQQFDVDGELVEPDLTGTDPNDLIGLRVSDQKAGGEFPSWLAGEGRRDFIDPRFPTSGFGGEFAAGTLSPHEESRFGVAGLFRTVAAQGKRNNKRGRDEYSTVIANYLNMTEGELVRLQHMLFVELGYGNIENLTWGMRNQETTDALTALLNFIAESYPTADPVYVIDQLKQAQTFKNQDSYNEDLRRNVDQLRERYEQAHALPSPQDMDMIAKTATQTVLGYDGPPQVQEAVRAAVEGSLRAQAEASPEHLIYRQALEELEGSEEDLTKFMMALSGQESSGNAGLTNPDSGAYGEWQIMPGSWAAWTKEFNLDPNDRSRENQYRVARAKLSQYFGQFGNWADVASAWYSGQGLRYWSPAAQNRAQYSGQNKYPSILEYVNQVMARFQGQGGLPSYTGGNAIEPPTLGVRPMSADAAALEAIKTTDPVRFFSERYRMAAMNFMGMLGENAGMGTRSDLGLTSAGLSA